MLVDPVVVGAIGSERTNKPRDAGESLRRDVARNHKIVVQPFILAPLGIGRGNAPRSTEQPMPTVLASRGGGHLVTPVVVQVNHGEGDMTRRSHSVEHPLPTICASPGMGLAQPCIVEVNHGGPESGRSQSIKEPLKAVTTKNGKAIVDPTIVKYYSNGDGKYGQSVDEPLDTVTTKQRFALAEPVVTRIGIDIRFRMFRTQELARAMGFELYQFCGTIEEQTRQIGNAVEVNNAKALARAMLE
jgi:DNA (cytosine-5)-methyltransferase 1